MKSEVAFYAALVAAVSLVFAQARVCLLEMLDDAPDLSAYQTRVEKGAANGYAGLDVAGLVPLAQLPGGLPPAFHAVTHQNGGADELSVLGLSGLLADAQTPLAHAASHKSGGADSIKLDEMAAPTDVTTLNASASAHGLLPKLSGSSSQYLDGTGAWSTPAGGGGGPSTVKKTADQTFNSSSLGDVIGLSFAVTSGRYYRFTFTVPFRSPTATVGASVSVSIPAATVFSASARMQIAADGVGGESQGAITASNDVVLLTAVPAINTDYLIVVEGVLLPSADGTLQLRGANETGATVVTFRQGGVGVLFDLGT